MKSPRIIAPAILYSLILTSCQTLPTTFTPQQVAAMRSNRFTESDNNWSMGMSDAIRFGKNQYKLQLESTSTIQTMASRL
jgi:outer membrane protein OmpA-like peptidoglycan-associated protein